LFSANCSLNHCSISYHPCSLYTVPWTVVPFFYHPCSLNTVPWTVVQFSLHPYRCPLFPALFLLFATSFPTPCSPASCYLLSCSYFCCTCSCTLFPALLLKMFVPGGFFKIYFKPLKVKLGRFFSPHLVPSTFDPLRLFLRIIFPYSLVPCCLVPFTLHSCTIHSCKLLPPLLSVHPYFPLFYATLFPAVFLSATFFYHCSMLHFYLCSFSKFPCCLYYLSLHNGSLHPSLQHHYPCTCSSLPTFFT